MAKLEFNANNIKRVPINRNNLFYSDESFNYELEIGKNYVEQDMNQTLVLYSVDNSSTNINNIYGETKTNQVRFKPPVEFHCVYTIEPPELKAYDKTNNIGTYMKTGKLKFGVYKETLDELGIELKPGDYIGAQINEEHMEFFSLLSINKGYDNEHSLFGVKNLYYECNCYPVDTTEFKA